MITNNFSDTANTFKSTENLIPNIRGISESLLNQKLKFKLKNTSPAYRI